MTRTLIYATPSIANILCVIMVFTFAYAQEAAAALQYISSSSECSSSSAVSAAAAVQ